MVKSLSLIGIGLVCLMAVVAAHVTNIPQEHIPWKQLKTAKQMQNYLENIKINNMLRKNKNGGEIYAVLVAGSNGWYNYRHQADVCHAYQIMIKHGVKPENIITMMFDDIANNPQNKNRGVIINKPNGPNVYDGVVIDYKGADVTPDNFLKVLNGDSSTGKKVLKSGPNDNVFVYFTDHGAPGIVAFPQGLLHANDLSSTLKNMHNKQLYKELVFYMEACESGSMFENGLLPPGANMYGTTAANDHESSYACYLDNDLQTYLGDCYSIAWMEDTDQNNIEQETISQQFQRVKRRTTESHVLQFGDKSIADEVVGHFQGPKNPDVIEKPNYYLRSRQAIPQEEVDWRLTLLKYRQSKNAHELMSNLREISKFRSSRRELQAIFDRIVALVGKNAQVISTVNTRRGGKINYKCYRPVVDYFAERCMLLNASSPALSHLYKFANLCQLEYSKQEIMSAMDRICA